MFRVYFILTVLYIFKGFLKNIRNETKNKLWYLHVVWNSYNMDLKKIKLLHICTQKDTFHFHPKLIYDDLRSCMRYLYGENVFVSKISIWSWYYINFKIFSCGQWKTPVKILIIFWTPINKKYTLFENNFIFWKMYRIFPSRIFTEEFSHFLVKKTFFSPKSD